MSNNTDPSGDGDSTMHHEPLGRSLNSSNNETLLPRKRSQATKSPVPPEFLAVAAASEEADESVAADGHIESLSSSIEKEKGEGPAPIRIDLRTTPHDMKNANISHLLHQSSDQMMDHEGGFEGDELLLNSSSSKIRASLNASFDAAAATYSTTATANSSLILLPSAIKANPKYSSPKRRKQSFDQILPPPTPTNQQQQHQRETSFQQSSAMLPPPTPGAATQHQSSSSSSSFTPLRPPKTAQKRVHRSRQQDNGILFSPKPVYSDEKKTKQTICRPNTAPELSSSVGLGIAATAGRAEMGGVGSAIPLGASGAHYPPSSPLTPSPKFANSNLFRSNSNDSSSQSPGTPFRFHAFPASLPRVYPRHVMESGTAAPRLDIASGSLNNNLNNDNTTTAGGDGGDAPQHELQQRVNLRPKPSEAPNNASSSGSGMRPPPSPASRRLFLRDPTASIAAIAATMEGEHGHNPHNNQQLSKPPSWDASEVSHNTLAPSLSNDQNDISGDWSESTSIKSLTNERIRMSKVPTHVSASHAVNHSMLNDLEEEEVDTVVMDEDHHSLARTQSLDTHDTEEELSRTRLNFGSSPPPDVAGQQQQQAASSNERMEQDNPQHESALESSLHPHTPRGIGAGGMTASDQFHLEVSPIVRLPEDHDMNDGDCSIPMKGSLDDDDDDDISPSNNKIDKSLAQPLFRDVASPILRNKSSEELHNQSMMNDGASAVADTLANSMDSTAFSAASSAVNTTASTANMNNVSNITRPMARKVRPMPDTSAFDMSGGTPSQHSLGSNDSGFHSHTASGTSDRLLCPPTPIRTPAWAHADSGRQGPAGAMKRTNSLISTKVLAACPLRVLDNLSSLEDSMLENDISGSTMGTADTEGLPLHNNTLAASFAPVEEEKEGGYDSLNEEMDEGETSAASSRMFRSLENNNESSDQISPTFRGQVHHQHQSDDVSNPSLKQPYSPTKQSRNRSRLDTESSENNIPESNDSVMTFSDFDNLGILGSGAFADVYKVRSKKDRRLYAIKRTRRQFRGVKDRERAMAEVHTMKRLQNALLSEAAAAGTGSHQKGHDHSKSNYGLYLLFFIRAWQQDGLFYCQTELCSRASCRHLRLSLSTDWERDAVRYPSLQLCRVGKNTDTSIKDSGIIDIDINRLIPERAIWQICHDISRGLFHIHSHNMVHYDIKPSNIFFVFNTKWGTMCKIGDFGLTGDVGTKDDGQEGDTAYMPNELLSSCAKHPGADIFSLGLALYELAAAPSWILPREGDQWHELRSGNHHPDLPLSRSVNLVQLIKTMIRPNVQERPSAEDISEMAEVKRANAMSDSFLSRYINDVERYDSQREQEMESAEEEARRRSSTPIASLVNHHALAPDTVARRTRDLRTPTNDDC